MPRVSVITRTQNRVLLLERAILSVLDQTFDDWVHVIVNDGGKSEQVDKLVEEYQDRYCDRLIVIHNSQSLGMEAASNIGVQAVDSEFIAIHDDDDYWDSKFLTSTVEKLTSLDQLYAGTVSHTCQIYETIDEYGVKFNSKRYFDPHLKKVNFSRLKVVNQFMPIAFLFKRSVYQELEGFNESFKVCGDWEFNLRLLEKYNIFVIPEVLAFYCVRISAGMNYQNSVSKAAIHQQYKNEVRKRYPILRTLKDWLVYADELFLKRIRCLLLRKLYQGKLP